MCSACYAYKQLPNLTPQNESSPPDPSVFSPRNENRSLLTLQMKRNIKRLHTPSSSVLSARFPFVTVHLKAHMDRSGEETGMNAECRAAFSQISDICVSSHS